MASTEYKSKLVCPVCFERGRGFDNELFTLTVEKDGVSAELDHCAECGFVRWPLNMTRVGGKLMWLIMSEAAHLGWWD